jgi:hypothetical protein
MFIVAPSSTYFLEDVFIANIEECVREYRIIFGEFSKSVGIHKGIEDSFVGRGESLRNIGMVGIRSLHHEYLVMNLVPGIPRLFLEVP